MSSSCRHFMHISTPSITLKLLSLHGRLLPRSHSLFSHSRLYRWYSNPVYLDVTFATSHTISPCSPLLSQLPTHQSNILQFCEVTMLGIIRVPGLRNPKEIFFRQDLHLTPNCVGLVKESGMEDMEHHYQHHQLCHRFPQCWGARWCVE